MKKITIVFLLWLCSVHYVGAQSGQTNFYTAFSWLSNSTPKDQGVQGPCHVFAAAAQMEQVYYLSFRTAVPNLSEKQYFSYCYGDYSDVDNLWQRIQSNGVVDEELAGSILKEDPYNPPTGPTIIPDCSNLPAVWKYMITYESRNLSGYTNKEIQDLVYTYGPITVTINCNMHNGLDCTAAHSMVLHGWTTSNGVLYWLFKDSWPGAPTNSYARSESLQANCTKPSRVITSISRYKKVNGSWISNPEVRQFTDGDGDGYYVWGVGPAPSGCPNPEQDFNDADATLGPKMADGYARSIQPPCSYPNLTAPQGQTVIYGPPQTGSSCASHTINSSYWKNITGDMLDWVPYSGSTPTANTGPDYNAPGGTGLYLYLEPTGGCYGSTAILESKYFYYIPTTGISLSYYYHMYGSTMGSLKVKIKVYPNTTWTEVGSTKSGNKVNMWLPETISLSSYKNKYINIRFEGTTGYGELSDLAIQNISLIAGSSSKSLSVKQDTILKNDVQDSILEVENNKDILNVIEEPCFELFPNPASSRLNIKVSEPIDYDIFVYNSYGILVMKKLLNSNSSIDINSLSKGTYTVKLRYKNQDVKTLTQKLVVNK